MPHDPRTTPVSDSALPCPTWELETEADTTALARRLAPLLRGGDLVVLSGPLGAGKTFLARELCHALGLPEEERVTSPTFTLVQEYGTAPPVSHADLYRLKNEAEVFELGLDAQRDEGRLVLVEWGAPYVEVLGGDAIVVELEVDPRRARVVGAGARASEVRRALGASW